MDNLAIVGAGLATLASKGIIERLLGPTADLLGHQLKSWTEVAARNINGILSCAVRTLGSKLSKEGSVPPRILRAILQEGQTCDDPLMTEYFGGILASSRSVNRRDDRGLSLVSLLGRLSTYQVRSHYVFYHVFKGIYDGRGWTIPVSLTPIKMKQETNVDKSMETFIPNEVYSRSMGFDDGEERESQSIRVHAVQGLVREQLLGPYYRVRATANGHIASLDNPEGTVVQPSQPGAELFLWAHGHSDISVDAFLNSEVRFQLDPTVLIQLGSTPATR